MKQDLFVERINLEVIEWCLADEFDDGLAVIVLAFHDSVERYEQFVEGKIIFDYESAWVDCLYDCIDFQQLGVHGQQDDPAVRHLLFDQECEIFAGEDIFFRIWWHADIEEGDIEGLLGTDDDVVGCFAVVCLGDCEFGVVSVAVNGVFITFDYKWVVINNNNIDLRGHRLGFGG